MKEQNEERECLGCGHKWIGTSSTCPQCGRIAKSGGEEFTKKVIEDNDLKKGL